MNPPRSPRSAERERPAEVDRPRPRSWRVGRARRPLLSGVVALCLLSAACTGGADAGRRTHGATGDPLPSAPRGPSPAAPRVLELADGRHFGFVLEIDTGTRPRTLVFDPAELLTGDRATRAGRADGAIGRKERLPAGLYVRTGSKQLGSVRLARHVRVRVVNRTRCCGTAGRTVDALAAALGAGEPVRPYWITVSRGVVVGIEEQFLP